jgi:hypothetical protein
MLDVPPLGVRLPDGHPERQLVVQAGVGQEEPAGGVQSGRRRQGGWDPSSDVFVDDFAFDRGDGRKQRQGLQ